MNGQFSNWGIFGFYQPESGEFDCRLPPVVDCNQFICPVSLNQSTSDSCVSVQPSCNNQTDSHCLSNIDNWFETECVYFGYNISLETRSGEQISSLATEWGLICSKEWIIPYIWSFNAVGNAIGAVIGGGLADKVGRRRTLLLVTLLVALFSFASSYSPNWQTFLVFWTLIWICQSAMYVTGSVYVVELLGDENREWAMVVSVRIEKLVDFENLVYITTSRILRIRMEQTVSICSFKSKLFFDFICIIKILNPFKVIALTFFLIAKCSTLVSVAYSVGVGLISLQAFIFPNWRLLMILEAFITVLYMPVLYKLPESSQWIEIRAKREIEDSRNFINEKSEKNQLSTIVTNKLTLRITLMGWLLYMANSICFFGLNVNSSSLPGNLYINTVLNCVAEGLGYAIMGLLMAKINRKPLIMSTLIISALICALCGILFSTDENDQIGRWLSFCGKFFISACFG